MITDQERTELHAALEAYKAHIISDYAKFSKESQQYTEMTAGPGSTLATIGQRVATEMFEKFQASVRFQFGGKYIKVLSGDSVHSFIVQNDMPAYRHSPTFKRGDILKAASWAAPAKNFARGNIFTAKGLFPRIRWTGAN